MLQKDAATLNAWWKDFKTTFGKKTDSTDGVKFEAFKNNLQNIVTANQDPKATFFDDDLESLTTRVKRLETEFAWAETPPSRTRHFISNTILEPCEEGEARARSHFMVTRTRSDNGYQMFTGERQDTLRRGDDGTLRFARRVILPDQTTITATNLSVFL